MKRCQRCNTLCPWLRESLINLQKVCGRCFGIETERKENDAPPGIVSAPHRTDYYDENTETDN